MDKEFPFTKGARVSLNIVGRLLIIMVLAAPIGIWILWRVSQAKLKLTAKGVSAGSLTTTSFDYADVGRIGICKVPILARGIGGALAKYKVGGDHGINLCVVLKNKKKQQIIISMYADYQTALDAVSATVGRPYETLEVGLFGIKWPEAKAA